MTQIIDFKIFVYKDKYEEEIRKRKIPIEIRHGAIDDMLVIFVHLEEGAVLMLNTYSHRIVFVTSSLSDQDIEEAFAPTSFSLEIWNSKP